MSKRDEIALAYSNNSDNLLLNLSPVNGTYTTAVQYFAVNGTHGTAIFDVRQKLADLGTACLF
jgi:hypothetical protein